MGSTARSKPRYPAEMRQRTVRLVFETIDEQGEQHGAIARVAGQLGVPRWTVSRWVRQAEVDAGRRTGLTSAERERLAELERENRELRRANEILKAASTFFAAELDRRPTK